MARFPYDVWAVLWLTYREPAFAVRPKDLLDPPPLAYCDERPQTRRRTMDALSEFLRAVKLSGAMFYDAHCSAPWCVRSPPSHRWRDYVAPPSSHVVEFHLVTEGRCYVRVGNETTALTAGDIVMLPHGDEHYVGNGVGAAVIDSEDELHKLLTRQLALESFGGGGEPTHFVCGYLACEARLMRPVLAGLPRVVRVRLRDDAAGTWLENTIRHAVTQATAGAPGSDVILRRLAEVLFVEALRRYVVGLPPGLTGWLAGAADPAIGRALAAMHRRAAYAWTLAEIAREAGLSRSALTERFTRYLGQSPMNYFADWRLELAAETLRTTNLGVVEVAAQVGYESEAAFNRAFKRRFALPPARYRRNHRDGGEHGRTAEGASPARAPHATSGGTAR